MIGKLRKKISLIIMLAIAIPLITILTIYTFSYYENVIRSNIQFIDRFIGEPGNRKNDEIDIINIDGVYFVSINNGSVVGTSENVTDEIKSYAEKVSKNNSERGIVGNYFYKKNDRGIKDREVTVVLIEGSSEINNLRLVIAFTILFAVILLFFVYLLSKNIAKTIVKPVEDAFNKQREFISDASHELKTPLAVIQANADVLEGEIGKNKWLSYIQNETDNMGKLISELLLLTKIENIDKLREPEIFNLSDHIELIISSFESMAFEKNVKIENKIQQDIITDKFNKDDITHILSTLVDNAIKHTAAKKKIIVELTKIKDKIVIEVKNKGEEIPFSEREKIFDRFYRIDKSRNRNEKRYGLGLSIAKATVLKNNGTILVDYKDGFTIFKVELPI